MYEVIEALINSNSLLKIDQRNLDADELIQVAQLQAKEKQATKNEEQLLSEIIESQSLASPTGGDEHHQYEGGTKKQSTVRSKARSSHGVNQENTRAEVDQESINSLDRELLELENLDEQNKGRSQQVFNNAITDHDDETSKIGGNYLDNYLDGGLSVVES